MIKKLKSISMRVLAGTSQPVLTLMFLVVAAGAILGSFSGSLLSPALGGITLEEYFSKPIASVNAFKFLALALLFSTSFLGVFLIPSLAFVKAYIFSCTIAALFTAFSFAGLISCFFALAIPALFIFPCLFIAYRDAFFHSRQLFEFKLSRSYAPAASSVKHVLLILVVFAAVSSYDYFLLPRILSALI